MRRILNLAPSSVNVSMLRFVHHRRAQVSRSATASQKGGGMAQGSSRSIARLVAEHWRTPVSVIGYAGLILLLGTVLADVALRFLFNRPIAGSIEYVSYWYMVAIAFCGIALAERYGEHIYTQLIFDHLPPSLRKEYT